jgi:hypothetical protein
MRYQNYSLHKASKISGTLQHLSRYSIHCVYFKSFILFSYILKVSVLSPSMKFSSPGFMAMVMSLQQGRSFGTGEKQLTSSQSFHNSVMLVNGD